MKRILVTGGAGFIGSHVVDLLLRKGYAVHVLDNLDRQSHPNQEVTRARLDEQFRSNRFTFTHGYVENRHDVGCVVEDCDAVVHLAAAVGVGQSMYEIAHYTRTNDLGTAVLLEALTKHRVEKLVVASSMSVYGEGTALYPQYSLGGGGRRKAGNRYPELLKQKQWDQGYYHVLPVGICETDEIDCRSVYALNKYVTERMSLIVGAAHNIPTVALRFFGVYGSRQALSNPYTGVLAIFASSLLNGRAPVVFEDGLQLRDYIHVSDVARAVVLALEAPDVATEVFNVGTGVPRTIKSIAEDLAWVIGVDIAPEITGKYRAGDIRHCYADISHATEKLRFSAEMPWEDGLREFVDWVRTQTAVDKIDEVMREMTERGVLT